MNEQHSPALRRWIPLAGLLTLALVADLAQGDTVAQASGDQRLLAQHSDHVDSHADSDHESGGKQGAGAPGNRGKRLGKGAGTGEARGGQSAESDIFRDKGFERGNPERGGGPPADRGGSHEDGEEHDHEDGEEGGGPPEGRGDHEDGEAHDHDA